jgi:6-oxo-cyclohex-1-ene-carbonyl-CoA hydrolase
MACDFSVAADDTRFGQAGPKHGSAPVGGSTDFLPLYVGFARAMESATLCETWTAYEALRFGLVNDIAPVWKENGEFVPFPLVVTDRWLDDHGRIVYGAMKTGADRDAAKARLERCTHDFARLDAAVETLAWKLALTMPECLTKTIEEVRRHKVAHWHANREANRAWLALNMNTEGKAGFRAFHHGEKGAREVDFLALRRAIAAGREFDDALIAEISPHRRAGAREA